MESLYTINNSHFKIYLPYLHEWKQTDGLMTLIQILIVTFEELPPVYSVQSTSQSSAAAMSALPQFPSSSAMSIPQPTSTAHSSSSKDVSAQIRTSFITAVSEKITRRLQLEDINLHREIERKTTQQLKERTKTLEGMMRKLENEKTLLEQNIKVYKNQVNQLNEKIEDRASREENLRKVIDDAIVAPTPLYNQIASLFAEEAAVEDTIYYLSEGLRIGRIDLEQFQKQIRTLSRKQFKLRATLYKCRQKAGLAG